MYIPNLKKTFPATVVSGVLWDQEPGEQEVSPIASRVRQRGRRKKRKK
jgi:hypothetical protein